MPRVNVSGWRPGVPRVAPIEVLRDHLGLGRAEAAPLAERILDGKPLRLEVETPAAAEALAAALHASGVEAGVDPEP